MLQISETFESFQGEGPDIGAPCKFIRVAGCPVKCPGCDSWYTWKPSPSPSPYGPQVVSRLGEYSDLVSRSSSHLGLVLTGGEPLMYHANGLLLEVLRADWQWKGLETSGYPCPGLPALDHFLDQFDTVSLSPKITPCLHGQHSDDKLESGIQAFMEVKHPGLIFKFVIRDQADIDALAGCNARHDFLGRFPVYVMPYGNERDEILQRLEWLLPIATRYGFILTPRLHALIWGAKRGV